MHHSKKGKQSLLLIFMICAGAACTSVPLQSTTIKYGCYTDIIHNQLEGIVGEEDIATSLTMREQHGQDESYHSCCPPEAVVFPASVAEVREIMSLCNKERIPVIPYGTGTGLEGGIGAIHVSMD